MSATMKAALVRRYGGPQVVRIERVPRPVPKENEALVRITATAVHIADARIRALRVPRGFGLMVRLAMGWSRPRQPVFGMEFAGEVAAVGPAVTGFAPGDRVVGTRGFAMGAHAEYVALAEDAALARIPDPVDDAEAVSVLFGGITALDFFENGALRRGEHVLVNGASGAVGTMAVQIARSMGATVTAVTSTPNVELVRSLGASRVIDYTGEDFRRQDARYDVIMDNVGNAPYRQVRRLLAPGGRYLMVIGDLWQMIAASWRRRVIGGLGGDADSAYSAERLARLVEMVETGALRPVICETFALEDIARAHALVDTGRKVGTAVVRVAEPGRRAFAGSAAPAEPNTIEGSNPD